MSFGLIMTVSDPPPLLFAHYVKDDTAKGVVIIYGRGGPVEKGGDAKQSVQILVDISTGAWAKKNVSYIRLTVQDHPGYKKFLHRLGVQEVTS